MKLRCLSIVLSVASVLTSFAAEVVPTRLDLTGRVTNVAGEPVPGATVLILAAGPRTGSSPLCPYNYEDCGKRTASDAQGQFRLVSLDPSMDFCIAALAPGYESYTQSSLLPESGPVPVKLRLRDLSKLPPERQVAGRVLDHEGRPVSGAILSVQGVARGTSTMWGCNDATELQVITDAQGEFHLAGRKDFDAVHVTVEALGFADRWARLDAGKNALVRVKPGAAVQGRLLWNGQPLAGILVAASSEERQCGKYFTISPVKTDADGRFRFPHLPPGIKFRVYAHMGSLRERGAGFLKAIVTDGEESEMDLGDLAAQPAYRVSGKVVLADGHAIPPQTRLMLDRTDTSDTSLAMLDADGRFEFQSVPAETVNLYVRVAGYRYSVKNPNLERNSCSAVTGQIAGDLADLRILLEPGATPNWNDLDHPTYEETQKLRRQPFRSAP